MESVEMFTCLVCRRDYDRTLEKCPQCNAWQGDNKAMVEPGPKSSRTPRPAEAASSDDFDAKATGTNEPLLPTHLGLGVAVTMVLVGVVALVFDLHIPGAVALLVGGVIGSITLEQAPGALSGWLMFAAVMVWVLALPIIGVAMLQGGHITSGTIALGVVLGPIGLWALLNHF